MYRVFVYTNIIFEHALKREHWQDCLSIFEMAERRELFCLASSASFFTLAYFIRKAKAKSEILSGYLAFIEPMPTGRVQLESALQSGFIDLEDAFEYHTAIDHADYFITLNHKDFIKHQQKGLRVLTPKEFLMIARGGTERN